MGDKTKTILAVLLFLTALILPAMTMIVGLGVNVFQPLDVNARNTLILIGAASFLLPMAGSVILFLRIQDLSWITAGFPFVASLLYSGSVIDAVPDVAPFVTRVDDTAVVSLGAILSFILTQRRNPRAPKWIFIPLVVAAVYTFLGGALPGGLDELIVQFVALLTFLYGSRQELPSLGEGEEEQKIPEE